MYKHFEKADLQRILQLSKDYTVDALLVVGTHPKEKEYPHLYAALEKLGLSYSDEKIEETFFGDIKSLLISGERIWFDVVYGTAYLSEVAHVACMLGSKANILLGSCGGLRENLNTGDIILPYASYGNESSTRMYQRDDQTYLYKSDTNLTSQIKKYISERKTIDEGKLMTVQSMLAETKDDVENWAKQGYSGVDMESATLFAISSHFNVPSAALIYVADNLIKNELVGDVSYEALSTQRIAVKRENFEAALKVLLKK